MKKFVTRILLLILNWKSLHLILLIYLRRAMPSFCSSIVICPNSVFHLSFLNCSFTGNILSYYRVIALISADIVPSLDIEGRKLASVRRYSNEGQYSPISVR